MFGQFDMKAGRGTRLSSGAAHVRWRPMSAFLVRLVLAFSLLFGSVAVPALARAEPGHHALEMIDLDCSLAEANESGVNASGNEKTPDNSAPALHIDHHHCSACIELDGTSPARDMPVLSGLFFRERATALASRATAPPTQPPSA